MNKLLERALDAFQAFFAVALPVAAGFALFVVLYGIVGNDDYQAELLSAERYCQDVRTGLYRNYRNLSCWGEEYERADDEM